MRIFALLLAASSLVSAAVSTLHVPNGGIQPQVVERNGVVHLLYYSGATDWNGKQTYFGHVEAGHVEPAQGEAPGFPVWSLIAACAKPNGDLVLVR
jgi:hypothetical protein